MVEFENVFQNLNDKLRKDLLEEEEKYKEINNDL